MWEERQYRKLLLTICLLLTKLYASTAPLLVSFRWIFCRVDRYVEKDTGNSHCVQLLCRAREDQKSQLCIPLQSLLGYYWWGSKLDSLNRSMQIGLLVEHNCRTKSETPIHYSSITFCNFSCVFILWWACDWQIFIIYVAFLDECF